jgi:putative acyl-CoA dehydrogenase
VVARTAEGGLSCYLVPRWRPDGRRNAVRIQRLKDKLGNRSNASGEVEFEDAWGLRVGEPGRGIPTILEMATHTRLNCVLGSTALMRAGLVQALAYARQRQAFGRPLAQQPLMRSVLADLALESEAALVLALRLAQAFEDAEGPAPDPLARAWQRLMTPAAKLWVCKRAVAQAGEALEVLGGNGYVEESSLARLYREAPVNSVWEGSGNVMALDLLRALGREREAAQRLWDDLAEGCGDEPRLRAALHALAPVWQGPTDAAEGQARQITQRLVLLAQAVLLRRHAPAAVAEGFIATRFGPDTGGIFGALDPAALDVDALLARALPETPAGRPLSTARPGRSGHRPGPVRLQGRGHRMAQHRQVHRLGQEGGPARPAARRSSSVAWAVSAMQGRPARRGSSRRRRCSSGPRSPAGGSRSASGPAGPPGPAAGPRPRCRPPAPGGRPAPAPGSPAGR